jgi:hypothetical protein
MTLSEMVALIASFVGMGTGIAGLTLSIINFRQDRPKLWVTVKPNMRALNAKDYDSTKDYMVIELVNIGRRPAYLSMVAGLVPDGRNFLVNDAIRKPQKIGEGDPPAQFLVDQSDLNAYREKWPGVYILARTADGRQYGRFINEKPKGFPDVTWKFPLRLQNRWRHRWSRKRRVLY